METEKRKTGVYPDYFYNYIKLVENENLGDALKNQIPEIQSFFSSIEEEKRDYKYAEGKWTIKEVLQHIIDTERIFAYRALAFARKDVNTLPSFDENSYAKNSNADKRNWNELTEELMAVRKTTDFLFNCFSEEQLNTVGKASNYEMSVKALGYTIAGHLAHHVNVLKERYLKV
jgi:uncharacterized damage-inducible protein DinB